MILSDTDILRRLRDGDLTIDPLADPDTQVQPASVDLRLGSEFLEFQRTNIPCIHPDSEREVEEYVAETHVPEGEEFVLHPGDFVLGSTIERVGIPNDLVAHVEGRSSLGRLAVVVHASLPADEELFLWTPEDGFGFHPIGEVVSDEVPALTVAFDPITLTVRTHRITDYLRNPAKRIYRVELSSGRTVRITKDHNLFTLDPHGKVTRVASEDAEGEFVMVPRTLPDPQLTDTELDVRNLLADSTLNPSEGAGPRAGTASVGATGGGASKEHTAANPAGVMDRAHTAATGSPPRSLPITPDLGWVLGRYIAVGTVRSGRVIFSGIDEGDGSRLESFFDEYDTTCRCRGRGTDATVAIVRSPQWARLFDEFVDGGEGVIPDRVWNWSQDVLEGLWKGLTVEGSEASQPDRSRSPELTTLESRIMYLEARLGRGGPPARSGDGDGTADQPGAVHPATVRGDGRDEPELDGRFPVPGALLHDYRLEAGLDRDAAAEATEALTLSVLTDIETDELAGVSATLLRRLERTYRRCGVTTDRLDTILTADVRFERVESVTPTDRIEPTYDLEVQPGGRPIENFLGGHGGVFLSNTAGLCDPGYHGQITLELSNLGAAPVALTPGMRISQLTFTELTSPADRPYGDERGSKYQHQQGPQASRIGDDPEFESDESEGFETATSEKPSRGEKE